MKAKATGVGGSSENRRKFLKKTTGSHGESAVADEPWTYSAAAM
jgi:hypothetical protein